MTQVTTENKSIADTDGLLEDPLNFVQHSTPVLVSRSNAVELNWFTECEIDVQGFIIQRKLNNNEFVDVDFIPGHHKTNKPKLYSFIDSKLEKGLYSYRLKKINLNHTIEYSQEIKVVIRLN